MFVFWIPDDLNKNPNKRILLLGPLSSWPLKPLSPTNQQLQAMKSNVRMSKKQNTDRQTPNCENLILVPLYVFMPR
jgi:hypothetical protein